MSVEDVDVAREMKREHEHKQEHRAADAAK